MYSTPCSFLPNCRIPFSIVQIPSRFSLYLINSFSKDDVNKGYLIGHFSKLLAEAEGFEPSVRFPAQHLSRMLLCFCFFDAQKPGAPYIFKAVRVGFEPTIRF